MNRCVGKNVTDAVESLTCALYLSTKCLKTVFEWISDIKLIPIKMAEDMISKFKYNVDYTLRQYRPLDDYKFETNDHVKDLFLKYFDQVQNVNPDIKDLLIYRMNLPPN